MITSQFGVCLGYVTCNLDSTAAWRATSITGSEMSFNKIEDACEWLYSRGIKNEAVKSS